MRSKGKLPATGLVESYCNETPIGIRQNFDKIDLAEKEARDLHESLRFFTKSLLYYVETSQNLSKRRQQPRSILYFEELQSLSELYNPDSLLGYVLSLLSETGIKQTNYESDYLFNLSNGILNEIQDILKDFPKIGKLKAKLTTMNSEIETARNRIRHGTKSPPTKDGEHPQLRLLTLSNKLEHYQTEILDVIQKFVAAQKYVFFQCYQILEEELIMHSSCIENIDNYINAIQRKLDTVKSSKVFGVSLKTHLESINQNIAVVIHDAVAWIINSGLDEEGIFRLAGNKSKICRLKAVYDSGLTVPSSIVSLVHVMCGGLKLYIRELPESLIFPASSSKEVQTILRMKGPEQYEAMKKIIKSLPKGYYENSRYLFKFLNEVSKHSKKNLMGAQNLGLVFGPTLVSQTISDDEMLEFSMGSTTLVANLISNFIDFFPEDENLIVDRYCRLIDENAVGPQSVRIVSNLNDPRGSISSLESNKTSYDLENDGESSFQPPYHFTNRVAFELLEKESS